MSHRDRLLDLLQSHGPLSSAAVQRELGISRPTLSRLMRDTEGEILRLGQTRRVRYAAPRRIEGLPEVIPVSRVDEDGRAHAHGRIRPLEPGEWAWEGEDGELRISTGLPREVRDLLGDGFMPTATSDDEAAGLKWLIASGEDLAGNLLVGDEALARFLALAPETRGMDELPALAREAEQGRFQAGSLDGHWPKFTAWMENHQILVKFARLNDHPANTRQADLLVAELLALETLRGLGIDVPPARIIDREGYRFLALSRFDRVGRLGRRAVIRLGQVGGKGVDPEDWRASATAMKRAKRLGDADAERIQLMSHFAALIGNNDAGGDNLAFFPGEDDRLSLAPAYDMLPMAAAPDADGRLPEALPPLPMPASGELENWRRAATAAADYWARLANEKRLSFDFRKLAAAQGKVIGERLQRLG